MAAAKDDWLWNRLTNMFLTNMFVSAISDA
jgi:hypothetical protein